MAFARILRSSILMGGASAVGMVTGLLRGKLVAVVLGPAGIGMMGMLTQLINTLTQILGFGVGTAGVKYVASQESEERQTREYTVLRFTLRLAVIGAIVALVLTLPVCLLTFGSLENLPVVMAASIAAPLAIVAMGLGALLQARGQVKAVAQAQVWSSLAAFALSVPLVWFGGLWGMVASLLVASVAQLYVVRKYCRVRLPGIREAFTPMQDVGPLVQMGIALIGTIVVFQLSVYLTRVAVVQQLSIVHAGYYQAAFSIAGTIPGFVFAAMGTDFYPRVSAAKNEDEALDITDRQIKAGVILATPCFVGLVLFGETLLSLFYSAAFSQALDLLRLMVWGVACRLVSWPLGFWLAARASPKEMFWLESISAILVTLLTFLLLPGLGLIGAGVAFLGGAVFYGILMMVFVYRKVGRGVSANSLSWSGLAILAMGLAQFVAMRGWSLWISGLTLGAISLGSAIIYLTTTKNEQPA
jgi:antigen flippase